MKKLKCTDGYWEIAPNGLTIISFETKDIIADCDTTDIISSISKEEMFANTKIMAASKDLLAALISANNLLKNNVKNFEQSQNYAFYQKAIKKATE